MEKFCESGFLQKLAQVTCSVWPGVGTKIQLAPRFSMSITVLYPERETIAFALFTVSAKALVSRWLKSVTFGGAGGSSLSPGSPRITACLPGISAKAFSTAFSNDVRIGSGPERTARKSNFFVGRDVVNLCESSFGKRDCGPMNFNFLAKFSS